MNTHEKLHILFVDDEQRVLDGLRRTLRPLAAEWGLRFVDSGEAALASLAEHPADVVVSDMRMPGMSGAQLLAKVRALYPQTIRIALSGQAGEDEVLGSVGPVQQFLMKPCEPDSLRATIRRLLCLRAALNKPTLRAIAGRVEKLPAAPESYHRLIEVLDDPETSVDLVGAVVAQDPAMTAKCLQLVNSAFFGVSRPARTATEAVSRLGLVTIRALALVVRVFESIPKAALPGLTPEAIWKRSCHAATRARTVSESLRLADDVQDTAYTAGMLSEIGRLALAADDPNLMGALLDEARRRNLPLAELELESLSATQAQVGAYLLGLWGFPEPCVNAVAYHEHPADSGATTPDAITALHIARAFAQGDPPESRAWLHNLDADYIETIGAADAASTFLARSGNAA
ncbi:MAG: HDOD domain-containing protein [Phycisphaerales bacterium]